MNKIEEQDNQLVIGGIQAEKLVEDFGSPLYVYDEAIIREKIKELHTYFTYRPLSMHYAMKANYNLSILKIIKDEGAKIDAVSVNEIKLARMAGFPPEDIIFTGSNISDEDMNFAQEEGVIINIENLNRLEKFGKNHPGSEICIRINPNSQATTHKHLTTGTDDSKFGITFRSIDRILAIAKEYDLTVIGVHCHIGTSLYNANEILSMLDIIFDSAKQFPDLTFIDIGGGYGVSHRPEQSPMDVQTLGKVASERFSDFCKEYGRELELKMEPGRYFVCEGGWILATVTNIKRRQLEKGERVFYGVDTNMSHLARPALYDAYHHMINASTLEGETETVDVTGNVCESGDILGRDREVVVAHEGDILAIMNVGAYGYAMASQYNLFGKPAEVLVANGNARIIKEKETFEDMIKGMH